VSYTGVIALVVLALLLRTLGIFNTDTSLEKAAGYVVFVFAALGIYLFLNIAETAMGGRGYPRGPPLLR
jgi:hypothetical protein